MVAVTNRKVSAASARTHTRKLQPKMSKFPGIFKKTLLVGFVGFLAWAYQATMPPPPNTYGSGDGPPVTASRIQLKDGRYLAYQEYGVPKDAAKHKIVFLHGFDQCRHDGSVIDANLSPDIVQSRGIYIVSFDRPGYGESSPHPTRTVKSLAFDIEELADELGLGQKFYIIGFSMGGQVVWSCLKYIPHRLAGAALLTPVVNYWWSGFPSNLSQQAYNQQLLQDQWALRVSHYMPWLTYWWNSQKLFPSSSVIDHDPKIFSDPDRELLPKIIYLSEGHLAIPRQQGEFETLHRDMMVGFGKWDFSPMDLKNPFSESEGSGSGSVHLWQGDMDYLVPVTLQRYIAGQLPWIQYHELSGKGHMFPYAEGMADAVILSLLG